MDADMQQAFDAAMAPDFAGDRDYDPLLDDMPPGYDSRRWGCEGERL